MSGKKLMISRAFVFFTNILFLFSGFVLMSLGALLLSDKRRVVLSRLLGPTDIQLEQPLFYYLSLSLVGLGFVIAIVGLLGCWTSCLFECCITTLYTILIFLLLVGEVALCVIVVFWPNLLGVDVRSARLIRALQRNYALPGREQFTAALDLAQTTFSCCGINGSNNYGTSWWRLQEVGRRELVVPLTCCVLSNAESEDAFLNPQPVNLTLCQTLNPSQHQFARHSAGCLEVIENWTWEQTLLFLSVGLILIFVKISALLSTLVTCRKIKQHKQPQISTFTSTQTLTPFESEHDYGLGIDHRLHLAGTTFGAKS